MINNVSAEDDTTDMLYVGSDDTEYTGDSHSTLSGTLSNSELLK